MSMRRATLVFVLLVAAAIAAEPLVHTHPLTQNTQNSCAVCVNAVGRITSLAAAPMAPQIVIAVLALPASVDAIVRASTPLASRAPPSI